MSLPQNYTLPSEGGSYTKFETGTTKIRILSDFQQGYQYFNTDIKPVKQREAFSPTPTDIGIGKDGKKNRIQAYVVCLAYNYGLKKIQILQITQKTIIKAINELEKNADWGDTLQYDLTITKSGEGLKTEYSVMPSQPKPLSQEVVEALSGCEISIDAWFNGESI